MNQELRDVQDPSTEPTARLHELADEIQAFLLKQIERLEIEIGQIPVAQGKISAAQETVDQQGRLDKFDRERELWDQQRQEEVDRLQQEGAMLRDAWQRLEVERRQLLADQELARRTATIGKTPRQAQGDSAVGADHHAGTEPVDPEEHSNWLQFQQMRRAIQAHNRQ